MSKEMLINVSDGEECRIAIVENGRLEEIYMERASATSHVGNIYKGRVTNVEPAIQAAFVDFGQGRNGFLHISDLLPTYFGKRGEDISESVGRKLSRRDRPPIQKCLKRGDEITVQIIKEGIGSKGPTLSTYLSIPGRILVMMPGMENFGVSRKIEDEAERRRLRKILDELDPIEGVGFIIRTAGMGKTKAEIERDLKYLTRLWETIKKISETTKGPVELYTEGDLVTRTVRDVYGPDIDRIIIDSREVARRVKEFVRLTAPRSKTRVEYYDQPIPLFHAYNIEREIELIHSRHVPLPSGGSLVIDSTEAIVAIDVNSGKFREHADAETTAFKTDMEAADEIPRQLKLRDLGGVIICDFIDLRFERHRRAVEQRLFENFKKDKAKTRILRMSEFGIIEVTRQRMRPSLKRSIYTDCPHCRGHGLVKTPESMALDVMRKLTIAVYDDRVARVHLAVAPEVATYLANKRRRHIAELEEKRGVPIMVTPASDLPLDDIRLELFDERDGRVYIESLGMTPEGDKAHRSASARREERNGHARRHPPKLRTVDPDDGTPFDDAIDETDDATSPKARKDRPEDHIRPLGMEPLREGAGHRGPRVVVPADAADAGAEGDAGPSVGAAGLAAADEAEAAAATADAGDAISDAAADMQAGEGEQPTLAADEESIQAGDGTAARPGGGLDQPEDGTGRRRRRRRRGGRGRRRGREQPALAAEGGDVDEDATAAAAAGEPTAGRAAEQVEDAEDEPGALAEPSHADDTFEASVGEAPAPLTEDVFATGEPPEAAAEGESGGSEGVSGAVSGEVESAENGDAVGEDDRPAVEAAEPESGSRRGRRRRRRGRGGRSGGEAAAGAAAVGSEPDARSSELDAGSSEPLPSAASSGSTAGPDREEGGGAVAKVDAAEAVADETDGPPVRGGRRRRRRGRRTGASDAGEIAAPDVSGAAADSRASNGPEAGSPPAEAGSPPAEAGSPAAEGLSTAAEPSPQRQGVPSAESRSAAEVRAETASRRRGPSGIAGRAVEPKAGLVLPSPRRMPTPVNVPPPVPVRRAPTPVAVPPPIPSTPLGGGNSAATATGGPSKSADTHLADDEPVDHQPLRRPQAPRDLDAIPDDMD